MPFAMNSSAQADASFWLRIHSPDLSERLMKEVYFLIRHTILIPANSFAGHYRIKLSRFKKSLLESRLKRLHGGFTSFHHRFRLWSRPLKRATFVVLLALGASSSSAQDAPAGPRSVWNIEQRGGFVMSSLYDGKRFYWFGTEDKGMWRYDSQAPEARAWRQFTTKEGLGDDNGYALAVDQQGRIWVGHQNHGVSVWNGRSWHNYDVLDGPLGERIFKIAVSPLDGSVWMATSRGLSVYDTKSDTWRYYGRWNGLPSDQIQALDFASDGTLYVGTQCDGLAIGHPEDLYKTWEQVQAPFGMPTILMGEGLPSNLIKGVLVGKDDTVYVATNYGLAKSLDKGRNWTFLRGQDWRDKLKGLTFAPQFELADDKGRLTLLEDYVTTLAEDAQGHIWLRPVCRPRRRAAVIPAFVLSRMISRSNSVKAADTWNTNRPHGVVVSVASCNERKPTPRASGSGAAQGCASGHLFVGRPSPHRGQRRWSTAL